MEGPGPTHEAAKAEQAAAGWYPNPSGTGQRYWDGDQWTHHVTGEPVVQPPVTSAAPAASASPVAPPGPGVMTKDPRNNTLAVAGYICALIPIVGLIIGLVLRSRRDVRGNYVLIATGVMFVIYILLSAGSGG